MTRIEGNMAEDDDQELLSSRKGTVGVTNKAIKEMAVSLAVELFEYSARDDFSFKVDTIAFGIKLLLKTSKIPCEEKGLFVVTE